MALLEVKNLQKSFGKTKVLKDISFSLEKGQVLVIIGSSGSGKTTLLRCLNFLETADKVFDYKENPIYTQNRVVYLDQPVYDRPEAETIKKNEAAFLPLIAKADPIVRLHPRQTENSYEGFRRDTAGNMWELECANSIGNDHVLMGLFSTAQFTPKMMFGTEPTLVFLYKLFGCNFDNTEGMIERIRSAYTNKDKIIVVETEEELKAILETVRKGDSFGK